MTDADAGVRLGAAAALGSFAHPDSRRVLESALADPHWNVRAQAAYALSRLRVRASSVVLCRHLQDDESALVRNACALALYHLGDPRAVPVLERALSDESDRVRREVVLALERTGDPEAPAKVLPLLHDPARRVRIAVAVVLGARRYRPAVGALLDRLGDADPWERPALVIALGRIGAGESAETLARAAHDPMRSVRVCAVHALSQVDPSVARRVARERLSDPAWAVRGAAALALGQVGDLPDEPELRPLLRDPHPWPRRGAIYALGQLGASDAAPEIRPALDDPDPEVRLAAVWALGHLGDLASEERLARMLRTTRPTPPGRGTTLSQGEGAVRLVSDADTRMFDALVEAVGTLARRSSRGEAARALAEIVAALSEKELDRPARLPNPIGASAVLGTTLRQLIREGRSPRRSASRPTLLGGPRG